MRLRKNVLSFKYLVSLSLLIIIINTFNIAHAKQFSAEPKVLRLSAEAGTTVIANVRVKASNSKVNNLRVSTTFTHIPPSEKQKVEENLGYWLEPSQELKLTNFPIEIPIKINIPKSASGDFRGVIELKTVRNESGIGTSERIPFLLSIFGDNRHHQMKIVDMVLTHDSNADGRINSKLNFMLENLGNISVNMSGKIYIKSKYLGGYSQIYKGEIASKKISYGKLVKVQHYLPFLLPSGNYLVEIWPTVDDDRLLPTRAEVDFNGPMTIDFLSNNKLRINPTVLDIEMNAGRRTVKPIYLENTSMVDLALELKVNENTISVSKKSDLTADLSNSYVKLDAIPKIFKLKAQESKIVCLYIKFGDLSDKLDLNSVMSQVEILAKPINIPNLTPDISYVDLFIKKSGADLNRKIKVAKWRYSKGIKRVNLEFEITNLGSVIEYPNFFIELKNKSLEPVFNTFYQSGIYLLPGNSSVAKIQLNRNYELQDVLIDIDPGPEDKTLVLGNFDQNITKENDY
jgi:hypothetical protein